MTVKAKKAQTCQCLSNLPHACLTCQNMHNLPHATFKGEDAQLDAAIARISADPAGGYLVYMAGHEGRGIGIANKIKAYELQDAGLDTVDANTAQGLPVDARQYDVAAAILVDLGVESVRLMSNNPAKVAGLSEHGVRVDELVPVVVPVHPETEQYLRTKVDRLGHVDVL